MHMELPCLSMSFTGTQGRRAHIIALPAYEAPCRIKGVLRKRVKLCVLQPRAPSLVSRSCSSRPRSVCRRRRRYHAAAPHAAMITNAMKQEPTTSAWQFMRAHSGRLSPLGAARAEDACVRHSLS